MTPAEKPSPYRCHRIYLAGSWKNQQDILLIRDILKAQGHEVDCFASEGNRRILFNWSELDDIQDKLPQMDAKDMLAVPRVQEAFKEDKKWLDWCDLCILTLPSGKSSHLEAGYAKGQGKTVVIFGDLQKGDFDVMYGFADAIFRCDELDQMVDFVNGCASHSTLQQEPSPSKVGIHCPRCNWHQTVDKDMWEFQSHGGHGYTCGSGQCPSHTYMVRDEDAEHDAAIAAAARNAVLDELVEDIWKDPLNGIDQVSFTDNLLSRIERLRQASITVDPIKEAIKQERKRIRKAVSEFLESSRKQFREEEKKFDYYGKDYLYDRGKAAGVAIFCGQDGKKDVLAIIDEVK